MSIDFLLLIFCFCLFGWLVGWLNQRLAQGGNITPPPLPASSSSSQQQQQQQQQHVHSLKAYDSLPASTQIIPFSKSGNTPQPAHSPSVISIQFLRYIEFRVFEH